MGDHEAVGSIISASAKEIRWSTSATNIPNRRFYLRYLADDLKSGKVVDWFWGAEFRPGRTGLVVISTDQLRALEAGRSTYAELFVEGRGPFAGHFERIEPQDVPMKVLVDDSEVSLPVIHVRGIFSEASGEFWILDDPSAAVVLTNHLVNGDFHVDGDLRARWRRTADRGLRQDSIWAARAAVMLGGAGIRVQMSAVAPKRSLAIGEA